MFGSLKIMSNIVIKIIKIYFSISKYIFSWFQKINKNWKISSNYYDRICFNDIYLSDAFSLILTIMNHFWQ